MRVVAGVMTWLTGVMGWFVGVLYVLHYVEVYYEFASNKINVSVAFAKET